MSFHDEVPMHCVALYAPASGDRPGTWTLVVSGPRYVLDHARIAVAKAGECYSEGLQSVSYAIGEKAKEYLPMLSKAGEFNGTTLVQAKALELVDLGY